MPGPPCAGLVSSGYIESLDCQRSTSSGLKLGRQIVAAALNQHQIQIWKFAFELFSTPPQVIEQSFPDGGVGQPPVSTPDRSGSSAPSVG